MKVWCDAAGVAFTRSRPYRKNDQAHIEQKNGAVVRRVVGYRRLQGLAATEALARLYRPMRLFVNFFQPSFKLAEKRREGARCLYAQRQGIEGTLSQAVRAFGLRRARYRGLAKTGLRHVATAAAVNLDRMAAWFAGRPLAATRRSRFAALA